eukprot:m.28335 g.28335  ORF g.28335 m.28335 type:complete len:402 (-) comp6038_c0_seq1:214-1419(-)
MSSPSFIGWLTALFSSSQGNNSMFLKAVALGGVIGVSALTLFKRTATRAVVRCESGHLIHDHSSSVISRVMLPDDANPGGNVHGGTILKMIDEAGWATATRFFNQGKTGTIGVAGLGRIERVNFHQPMFIGELAHVSAEVTYASAHCIEVTVKVIAENVIADTNRLTNTARLWYIVKEFKENATPEEVGRMSCLQVPKLEFEWAEKEEEGAKRYAAHKRAIKERHELHQNHPVDEGHPVLIHLVLPSDCYKTGVAQAGVILKLMDTAAGVESVRHCRTNVVTASLESITFLQTIYNGNLVELTAKPVFTSNKSMDVEVNVYAIDPRTFERNLAAHSIFTFVSLDKQHRPISIPQLVPQSDNEKVRFNLRKDNYEQRKAERLKKKSNASATTGAKKDVSKLN